VKRKRNPKNPVGYADFHTPVKSDIVAQTIDKIRTDIVAQTVDKLKTDIVAQTIPKLAVDITAQTLPRMAMDIVAQTIADLDIDIVAQKIAEVTIRPKMGAADRKVGSATLDPGASATVISVLGKGIFYAAYWYTEANPGSHTSAGWVTCDGKDVVLQSYFNVANDIGIDRHTPYQQLRLYAVDGRCYMQLVPPSGITFESSLELGVLNLSTATTTMGGVVIYAVI